MKATLLLTLGLAAVAASAQETPKIQTELNVLLANKYVWRGVNYVNDWVLQPDVTFSASGFSLGFWGNLELTNWNAPNYTRKPAGRLTEIDTTVAYGQDFSLGSWQVGYVDYQFPGTGFRRFGEWFVGASFDDQRFSPSVTIYRGDKSGMGTYVEVGASHEFTGMGQSVKLDGYLGYGDKKSNGFFYGNSKSALTHVQFDVSTSFSAGKGWSLTPSISYSTLLEKNHLAGQPRRSNVTLGLAVSRSF